MRTPFFSLRRARAKLFVSPFRVAVAAVAILAAVVALYPLIRVLLSLFIVDGKLDLSALGGVLQIPDLGDLLWNTFSIVLVSGAIALVVGGILAWLNERTDARLGMLGRAMPVIPFLVPPIASGVGWLLLFHPDVGVGNVLLRDLFSVFGVTIEQGPFNIVSWTGLTFVLAVVHVPYAYMILAAAFRNFDGALEEQSRVCGANTITTFFKVTLPAVRGSVGSAVLLLVFFGLADYSIPVIIGTAADLDVLAVRVVELMTGTYPPKTQLAVGLSLIAVVSVAILWYFQRRLLRGGHYFTMGGKKQSATTIRLGAWRLPCRVFAIGFIVISSVLPLGSLVIVALVGYWSADPQFSQFSFNTFRDVLFDDPTSLESIQNSLFLAVVGATVGVLAATLVIEFVSSKRGGRFKTAIDGIVKAPATFSAIIVTIGVILAFSGKPFYLGGSLLIILLAYIVIYMPQSIVTVESSVAQVGSELREASAISGSSEFGTFRRIATPLIVPGLVAGWALLFVRMIGDLTASVMLAGPTSPVIGFRILRIYTTGSFGSLAALTLIVTVISMGVVFLLLGLSSRTNRVARADSRRRPHGTAVGGNAGVSVAREDRVDV